MQSNGLSLSKNQKYIVSTYFDFSLYKLNGKDITFVKNLGELKNPDRAVFFDNDSKILVRNNNTLIEVYDINTLKRLFKRRCSGAYEGQIHFVDNDTFISSNSKGSVYSLCISENSIKYHVQEIRLVNTDIFHLKAKKFILIGESEASQRTQIYLLIWDGKSLISKHLYSTSLTFWNQMLFMDSRLYFVTLDNRLVEYEYHETDDSLTDERIIHDFSKHNLENIFDHKECISEIFDLPFVLIFRNMCLCGNNKHLTLAFNGGLVVLDAASFEFVSIIPTKDWIDTILITEDKYLWLSSGLSVRVCLIDDVAKGIYNPVIL